MVDPSAGTHAMSGQIFFAIRKPRRPARRAHRRRIGRSRRRALSGFRARRDISQSRSYRGLRRLGADADFLEAARWRKRHARVSDLGARSAEHGPAGRDGTLRERRHLSEHERGQSQDPRGRVVNFYLQAGGPSGWLGFPASEQQATAAGNEFVSFQNGLLVYYLTGTPEQQAVYPFQNLTFWYEHVAGHGSDCFLCGGLDVYTHLTVNASRGAVVDNQRIPSIDDGGGDFSPRQGWALGLASPDFTVDAWDADDSSHDDLLRSAAASYNIDNLWRYYADQKHGGSNGDHSMDATFNTKNEYPYDPSDFRGELWWSFPWCPCPRC